MRKKFFKFEPLHFRKCALKSLFYFSLGCSFSCSRSDFTLVKVGDYEVTESMVEFREKVSKIYYPKEPTKVGLDQLVRAYTMAHILKIHGVEITEEMLQREQQRIDKNTRDPVMLGRLKDVFGKNAEAYKKCFILPNLVEKVFYNDFFLQSKEIQQESQKAALRFHQSVLLTSLNSLNSLKSKDFLKIAKKDNFKVYEVWLDIQKQSIRWQVMPDDSSANQTSNPLEADPAHANPSQGGIPANIGRKMAEDAEKNTAQIIRQWQEDIAGTTQPGQVYKNLVDQGAAWAVVYYIGKMQLSTPHSNPPKKTQPSSENLGHRFLAINFPKLEFSKWLEQEKKKVSIVTMKYKSKGI